MSLPCSAGAGGGTGMIRLAPSFVPHVWQNRAAESLSLAPQTGQGCSGFRVGSFIKRETSIAQAPRSLNEQITRPVRKPLEGLAARRQLLHSRKPAHPLCD